MFFFCPVWPLHPWLLKWCTKPKELILLYLSDPRHRGNTFHKSDPQRTEILHTQWKKQTYYMTKGLNVVIFHTLRERCECHRWMTMYRYCFTWLLTNHMELLRSSQWHSMNWATPWWENVYAFACLWTHMASIWWCSARPVLQPSSVLACFSSFTPSVWSSAHKNTCWLGLRPIWHGGEHSDLWH